MNNRLVRYLWGLRIGIFSNYPSSRLYSRSFAKEIIRKYRYLLFGRLPLLGRKDSPGETTKAFNRRLKENFFFKYCQGKGIDIGYCGDPITKTSYVWDFEHGNAETMNKVQDSYFDYVYSGHVLEHLPAPSIAIKNWWRILKEGGYLILYLPHRDLYEKKECLPSRFNDDHLHFFMPDSDIAPDTIGLRDLIEKELTNSKIIYIKTCDSGYHNPGDDLPSVGEFSIEAVIQKIRP